MEAVTIQIKKLPGSEDLSLPQYMTSHAAGMDLVAAVAGPEVLDPGKRSLVPTGIAIALPEGVEAQIRPRSGLAVKNGIGLLNSPGTIDADYRGEIKVLLINMGDESFTIRRGDRIAQIVFQRVLRGELLEVRVLPVSGRNEGGFGHTGS
jgi:dUTP pyrophosphatase